MVYWTCISLLKNKEDAEDMVQETFITAFTSYDSLKDKERVAAWIKRMAANKCINKLTRTRTVAVEDEFLENVEAVPDDFLPASITEDREKRSIMMKIINEVLSEELQRTLILYYFDELSAREIADLLKVPEGTIRSRLDYAKKKIKKGVEDYEKKNNDKLYAMGLPFLTQLFIKEAEDLPFVPMPASLADLSASSTATAGVSKAAATTVIKKGNALMLKKIIAASIAALTLTTAGVATYLYLNKDKNDKPDTGSSKTVGTSEPASSKETADDGSKETLSDDPAVNLSLPAYALTEKESGIQKTFNAKGDILTDSVGGQIRRSDGGYDRCMSVQVRDSMGNPLELYYIDDGNKILKGKHFYDDEGKDIRYEYYNDNGEVTSIHENEYENGKLKKKTITSTSSNESYTWDYEYYDNGNLKTIYETRYDTTRIKEEHSEDGRIETIYDYFDYELTDGSTDHNLVMASYTHEYAEDHTKMIKSTHITTQEYCDRALSEEYDADGDNGYTIYEYDSDGYRKKQTRYTMDGSEANVIEYELTVY